MKWFRVEIEEPEPGKILSERDLDGNGAVTTFIVERLLAPAFLRRVYAGELFNLEKVPTGEA